LSPTADRIAIGCQGTAGGLRVLDATSGTLLHSYTAAYASVRTVAWQDGSPTASYADLAGGCPGTLGTPTLAAYAGTRPKLGTTFFAGISHVPNNVVLLATGLSSAMTSAGQPLPLDLTSAGAPGCFWRVDPLATALLLGTGSIATSSWAIPASQTYFGLPFYQQALVLDAAANPLGATVSNATVGVLGF